MTAVAASSQSFCSTLQSTPSTLPSCSSAVAHIPLSPPSPPPKQFAFARIQGTVCLVQLPQHKIGSMCSALAPSDVRIFRHEFITQFRFSHAAALHPADVHVLEPIDEAHTLYEEDKGTVFLARELMARLQALTVDAQRTFRRPRVAGQISRSH